MNNKNEYPLLFNSEMVNAIQRGHKTQTRRIVNPRIAECINFLGDSFEKKANSTDIFLKWNGVEWMVFSDEYPEEGGIGIGKLFGNIQDCLWVKETFSWDCNYFPRTAAIYKADGYHKHDDIKWTPSIFMPRYACRLLLEITDFRVEKLQEISVSDAIDEGCPIGENNDRYAALEHYKSLWDSINKKHPWNTNPWVFVIKFKIFH